MVNTKLAITEIFRLNCQYQNINSKLSTPEEQYQHYQYQH